MKSQIYGLKILVLLTLFSSDSLADSLPNQIVWNQDGAEMASQLAQFNSLEQMINMNTNLANLQNS